MAQQDRTRGREGSGAKKSGGVPASDKRQAIAALMLMTLAVLLFGALLSYNLADESLGIHPRNLLDPILGNPDVQAKDRVHNALGLAGALVADFLIKSGIGYSVLVLPLLMIIWGWAMLRRRGFRSVIQITNYLLSGAVLLSASLGMIRQFLGSSGPGMEWSGAIGDYCAQILSALLGHVGGAIVLLVAMFITLVLAVDLDVHKTVDRLRALGLQVLDWFGRVRDSWEKRREARRAEIEENGPRARAPVNINRPEKDLEAEEHPLPILLDRPPLSLEITRKAVPESEELEPRDPSAGVTEDIDYVFPSVDLLDSPKPGKENVDENELKMNADRLRDTLLEFDVEVDSVSVTPGPVITLYELVPSSGVKISRIVSLENDIALKLAAKGIRIMAPIPGKSAVGVEIPNSHRSLVTIRSVINSAPFRDASAALPIAMGKTVSGEVFTDDLAKMPHLLIAGSTGSGKSVGINTILASLLYRMHPSMLKLVLVDPKKIELAQFKALKNHFLARSPDVDEEIITTPANAVQMLKGVEIEMDRRYERLASAGIRNIADYNERIKDGRLKSTENVAHARMPYLVVVIDELADLMITAAREVEEPIARLAQMARGVGIHLVVATQRPSVDVITGVIKANFPARVAYQVSSKTDSRTILDMNGAEQLLGNGDMLYLPSGSPKPVRLQNAYISPDEVEAIVGHISRQPGYAAPFLLPSATEKRSIPGEGGPEDRDELFDQAARLIVRHQQGSVSLLQRRLKIGYSRAARLVDELEAAGIVGHPDGSKARQVLVETSEELENILNA